eukprot:1147367-Pelagomonas_calceolata.AAC.4
MPTYGLTAGDCTQALSDSKAVPQLHDTQICTRTHANTCRQALRNPAAPNCTSKHTNHTLTHTGRPGAAQPPTHPVQQAAGRPRFLPRAAAASHAEQAATSPGDQDAYPDLLE